MTQPFFHHALGPNPTTDEIDAVVHDLIDRHFAGQMSERQARRQISGAIYASGIHEEVAQSVNGLTQQARMDLADRLLTIITDKMINDNKFYSFKNGRRGSACGWARQFARSAVLSEMRNVSRADKRNGTPLDPSGYEFSVLSHTPRSLLVWDGNNGRVDSDVGRVVEEYAEMTKGMRATDRLKADADALVLGLGVAPAVRPELMADRDFVLASLEADDKLAHRSLSEWRAVLSSDVSGTTVCDERLTALWDDQDETTADILLETSPDVAHALAVAAVSPLPRPSKKAMQRLVTVVAVGDGKKNAEWKALVAGLVESWVASEYEAYSQYAALSAASREKAVVGHTIARGRLDELMARAAAFPGFPLGKTPREVLSRLAQAAEAVLADEPSKNVLSLRVAGGAG